MNDLIIFTSAEFGQVRTVSCGQARKHYGN